jgi:TIR domain
MTPRNLESHDARQLIAEANKILARLQTERLHVLSKSCMPVYTRFVPKSEREVRLSPFALHPQIAQLLAGSLDSIDYTDSESAEDLDRVVESFARQLRLYRKRLQNDFDVFLCHNSEDKREVRSIDEQLKRRGLLPWLDEQELQPGTTWQSRILESIKSIKSCAVVVGPSGQGPWQRREVEAMLQLFVERSLPVIPVILPSCGSVPDLPLFLKSFGWVDYRTLDPDPLEQLIWGVSGRRSPL